MLAVLVNYFFSNISVHFSFNIVYKYYIYATSTICSAHNYILELHCIVTIVHKVAHFPFHRRHIKQKRNTIDSEIMPGVHQPSHESPSATKYTVAANCNSGGYCVGKKLTVVDGQQHNISKGFCISILLNWKLPNKYFLDAAMTLMRSALLGDSSAN